MPALGLERSELPLKTKFGGPAGFVAGTGAGAGAGADADADAGWLGDGFWLLDMSTSFVGVGIGATIRTW